MSDKVYEYKEVRVVYGKDGNEVMFVGGGGGGGGGVFIDVVYIVYKPFAILARSS